MCVRAVELEWCAIQVISTIIIFVRGAHSHLPDLIFTIKINIFVGMILQAKLSVHPTNIILASITIHTQNLIWIPILVVLNAVDVWYYRVEEQET